MPVCHAPGPASRRQFIITPYALAADGRLEAVLPGRCPLAKGGDTPCAIGGHHRRERKTGPSFPVQVARCRTHGTAFTLYPPGQRPYGRVAVAPVSVHGEVLLAADSRHPAEPPGGGASSIPEQAVPPPPPAPPAGATGRGWPAWPETVFGAAVDAGRGLAWPRSFVPEAPEPGYWSTQVRAIDLGGRILGVHVEVAARERERIAGELGLPALVLHDAARSWAAGGGYRAHGAVIVGVLSELRGRRAVDDGLLASGAIAGLWGLPSRWDPGGGLLFRLGVPVPGTGPGTPAE